MNADEINITRELDHGAPFWLVRFVQRTGTNSADVWHRSYVTLEEAMRGIQREVLPPRRKSGSRR